MKSKVFYVGLRAAKDCECPYEVGICKRDWNKQNGFTRKNLDIFCKKDFEKLTGIKLKPGQVKKFKLVEVK